MQVMGQRLQVTEQRQQQMMTFLAKAMQNPAFLAQLMQQSESNKRLAATVRKKRRLPKQDEGGEDSLNADSPPDGQMVTFQPNGAGEPKGARSMLMQFLNALESSSPNHDSTPLDTLFRDMSSGMSIPEMNTLNRQSGVTLTEMQMSGLPDTLPVVTDVPDESMLHISPPPTLHIPRLEGKDNSFTWFFEMPTSIDEIPLIDNLCVWHILHGCCHIDIFGVSSNRFAAIVCFFSSMSCNLI